MHMDGVGMATPFRLGQHHTDSPSLLSANMLTMDPTSVRQQGMAGLSRVRASLYLCKVSYVWLTYLIAVLI